MIRIILGVIVGFVVWSIFWIGSDKMMIASFPEWYGKYSAALEDAFVKQTPFTADALISAANLVRSFITSLIAGYMAALVAGEYKRSTMVLGVILIAVGIAVEYFLWAFAPAWYHILFVLFLLPMTVAGGRIRRPN